MSKSLQKQYASASKRLQKVVDAIEAKILELPDNPSINRLSPKCFTIRSKDLQNNWTPAFHDFKEQYRLVVEALRNVNVGRAMVVLKEIINARQVRCIGGVHGMQSLHPDVLKYLQLVLDE